MVMTVAIDEILGVRSGSSNDSWSVSGMCTGTIEDHLEESVESLDDDLTVGATYTHDRSIPS